MIILLACLSGMWLVSAETLCFSVFSSLWQLCSFFFTLFEGQEFSCALRREGWARMVSASPLCSNSPIVWQVFKIQRIVCDSCWFLPLPTFIWIFSLLCPSVSSVQFGFYSQLFILNKGLCLGGECQLCLLRACLRGPGAQAVQVQSDLTGSRVYPQREPPSKTLCPLRATGITLTVFVSSDTFADTMKILIPSVLYPNPHILRGS